MSKQTYDECRKLFDESGKRLQEIEQELIDLNEELMEEYNVRDYARIRLNSYRSEFRKFQEAKKLKELNPYIWMAFASVMAFAVIIPANMLVTFSIGKMVSIISGLVASTVLAVIGRKTDLARREYKTYPEYMEDAYSKEIDLMKDTIDQSTKKRSILRDKEQNLISQRSKLKEGRKEIFQYIKTNYPQKVGFLYQNETDFGKEEVKSAKILQK